MEVVEEEEEEEAEAEEGEEGEGRVSMVKCFVDIYSKFRIIIKSINPTKY